MKIEKQQSKLLNKTKDLMYLDSYINIADNRSATVENCKQIIECTDILAKVQTGSFEVEIWGSELKLSSYAEGCVEITGKIEQVKLVSRKFGERE